MTLKDIKINHGSLQSDWTLVGGGDFGGGRGGGHDVIESVPLLAEKPTNKCPTLSV